MMLKFHLIPIYRELEIFLHSSSVVICLETELIRETYVFCLTIYSELKIMKNFIMLRTAYSREYQEALLQ